MAEATIDIDITLTSKMGDLATHTVTVPLTLNAHPQVGDQVPVTVDSEALASRLTSAMAAFEKVAGQRD